MKKIMVCLCGAAVLLAGCSALPQEAEEVAVTVQAPVVTQREIFTLRKGDVESRLSLSVAFGAERQASLYFRSGGRIRRLHASVGQRVEAGQLLAELENGSLAYDVANADIDLQRKQLSLADAISRQGFVNAPSANDLAKLELDVQQSEAALAYKREQLNNTRLHAPFSGRIISLAFAEGDQADAFKEAMVLAGDGNAVARVNIDDATATQLRVGGPVEIFPTDGDPTPVKGKVASVPLAGTLRVDKVAVFAPLEPSPRIQPGRNGKVEVILDRREDVLLVPLSAIRSFGGREFVTLVRGETRQEVSIRTGLQGTAYAEVLEGLQAGDRVVSR